ncbi:MAG: radical SAM protein [Spirochaetales bacterium]|nr:radical SAM protein [Spirochaetales bacterium]
MFHPDEIIFAPTGRCNLSCSHCRVKRGPEELSIADAVAFLDSCADGGIGRVGFSGGEPFLRLDFIVELTKAALARDMFFDRLMTNGDWWIDEAELRHSLAAVYDAGFDGVIGLSWDAYHGQEPERVLAFLHAVFDVRGRRDAVELLSVRSSDDATFFRDLDRVAAALGGRVESEYGEPVRVVDDAYVSRREDQPDDGAGLVIPIARSAISLPADELPWKSAAWFEDDWCEGPGNVLYVHPYGAVAPCCGFANEEPRLFIGTIHDSYDQILAKAATNPQVRACFDTGLGVVREHLEAAGVRFPGKTRDMCAFCEYTCRKALAEHEALR